MKKKAIKAVAEALEDRRHLTVTLNAAGFSVVTPDNLAKIVYVSSSSGNDGNSGLSASAAVATLSKGYSLLRSGYDDQLLLKRGDTWSTTFPVWTLSGESQQFPMLVGTYGSGNRPLIDCGSGDGFDAYKKTVNDVFLQGIEFTDDQRNPNITTVTTTAAAASPTGFELQQPSTGMTVEDCSFTYFFLNFGIQNENTSGGSINNLLIRRSVSAFAYCTASVHAQGFYAVNTAGITLDQDIFDHNGWNANVSGAGTNGYNHDIYSLSTATGMVVTNCIIADASASGIICRGGAVIDGSLFLNDAVGVSFGEANGATSLAGGVTGEIDNNVFMDNHPEGTTNLGQGIDIGNIKANSGVTVTGNIFADDDEQASAAITLDYATGTSNPTDCVGINDLTVADNIIYGWYDGLQIAPFDDTSSLMTLNDVTIIGNQLQSDPLFMVNHQGAYLSGAEHWNSNVYYSTYGGPLHLQNTYPTNSQWLSIDPGALFQQQHYTDPTRTVATYNATLGGTGTLAGFMSVEDAQSDLNWSSSYTAPVVLAYLRAGFAASVTLTAGQTRSLPPTPSGRAVYTDSTLTLAGNTNSWTGTFDIGNNDVDLTSASISAVANQIKQGISGSPPWSGQGITSSNAKADASNLTAVAAIQNNATGSPLFSAANLFGGVDPGASDILLKYTFYGDTNLDGKVDGSDYSRIDNGFTQHLTGWNNGDFNYDGTIDGSDYTLIDNAFNRQSSSLAATPAEDESVNSQSNVPATPQLFPAQWLVLTTGDTGDTGDTSDAEMKKRRIHPSALLAS